MYFDMPIKEINISSLDRKNLCQVTFDFFKSYYKKWLDFTSSFGESYQETNKKNLDIEMPEMKLAYFEFPPN